MNNLEICPPYSLLDLLARCAFSVHQNTYFERLTVPPPLALVFASSHRHRKVLARYRTLKYFCAPINCLSAANCCSAEAYAPLGDWRFAAAGLICFDVRCNARSLIRYFALSIDMSLRPFLPVPGLLPRSNRHHCQNAPDETGYCQLETVTFLCQSTT